MGSITAIDRHPPVLGGFPMQVFIAGSTGVLGRRLIQQFTARGDKVVAMVRNEKGERIVSQLGAIARYADLFNVDSLAKAADGSEVVIHAATSIPTKSRTTARDWAMNDRIRREGTAPGREILCNRWLTQKEKSTGQP